MPYDYIEEYQKQDNSTIYKFLAGALKENNDILPEIEDKQPYLYRATSMPDGSVPYVQEKLIGASAAVNQLVQNGNFADTSKWNIYHVDISATNNILTFTGNGNAANIKNVINFITDHKYIIKFTAKTASGSSTMLYGYTQYESGSSWITNKEVIVTTTKDTYSFIVNSSVTAKVSICILDKASSNWNTLNIENVYAIDLTQMFGTAIADLAYSKEQASAGSGIAWLKSYGFFTKDYYPYNTGALQSVKTDSKKVVGKNFINPNDVTVDTNTTTVELDITPNINYTFSVDETQSGLYAQYYNGSDWTSFATAYGSKILKFNSGEYSHIRLRTYKSGTQVNPTTHQLELGSTATSYEPYTSTTYPLDSDLELRGLYKLDANNNIVCDGDEYTPDGNVKRRYGIVDLGSLNWALTSGGNRWAADNQLTNAKIDSAYSVIRNAICAKYQWVAGDVLFNNDVKGFSYYIESNMNRFFIKDTSYASASDFKLAMNGVYFIYELATETTDTAASYQNPQIIHENGTEEFIDTRDYSLPVGHDTGYFTASDEKFFLPPVVDNDGRFLYHDGDGFQFKNFNQVASKVEESDINGNIKIDSVETQVYDDSELQGIVDTDTTTATGNPLNFSTKSAQNAVNTDIVIDPVQDLHGFTKPWVGGAGKNLFNPVFTSVSSAIHITNNNDGTIDISADSSTGLVFIKGQPLELKANTRYDLSLITTGTDSEAINFSIRDEAGSAVYANVRYGLTNATYLAPSDMTVWTYLRLNSSAAFTKVTNKVQLEIGSLATTWEPYTNICPISPKEQITVQGCGKNLCKYLESGIINNTTGQEQASNTANRTSYIDVLPNEYYTLSGFSGTDASIRIHYFYKDGTYKGNILVSNINGSTTQQIPNDVYFMRFQADNAIMSLTSNIQVERGQTATSYEPYNLNTDLQIPLPNDFYGGTLNLESGELRVEKAIVDLGSLTWQAATTNTTDIYRMFTSYTGGKPITALDVPNAISSCYEVESPTDTWAKKTGFTITSTQILIYDPNYNTVNSASSFKTFITGHTIVYELETSYTLHLTPQQLNLLKATNNISTDAKTISVTYRNGELSTYAPATDIADGLLTATDKRAIDRTSDIVEGNPIQFSTESKQIARSTIIDLEPIQDLHGFTKPWVGGAGKNLFEVTASTDTNNGVLFTVNDDGTVKAIRQSSSESNASVVLGDFKLPVGTYKINGTYSSSNGPYMTLRNGLDNSWIANVENTDYTLEVNDADFLYRLTAVVLKSTSPTGNYTTLKPMIRKSTVTDASFEPYENICPISGRSEVDIQNYNKNMARLSDPILNADRNVYNVKFHANSLNEVHISSTGASGNAFMTDADPNTSFYLSKGTYTISSNMPRVTGGSRVYLTSPEEGGLGSLTQSWEGNSTTFTLTKDLSSVNIQMLVPTGMIIDKDIWVQVEKGSQVTPYEKHIESTSLQIQLNDTVYGGKLDVENGVLVVDKASVDLGDLDWVDLGTAISGAARFKTTLTNKPIRSDLTNGSTSYCSHYDLLTDGATYTANKDGYTISTTDIVFFVDAYKTSSTSAFKTAMSGVQVVYTLQDEYKTTIQLTPHAINLLKGVNTITTNGTSITLNYRNGEMATLEDVQNLTDLLMRLINNLSS